MKIVKENIEFKRGQDIKKSLQLGEKRKFYEYDPEIPTGNYMAKSVSGNTCLIQIYCESDKIKIEKKVVRITNWYEFWPQNEIWMKYGAARIPLKDFLDGHKYSIGADWIQKIDLEFELDHPKIIIKE